MQSSRQNCISSVDWHIWDLKHFITNDHISTVLIILNQPIVLEFQNYIKRKWNVFSLRIAVDGGLIYLDEMSNSVIEKPYVPDIISGDFDSVPSELLDKYSKLGSRIIQTPDQNYTDFTKALNICYDIIATDGKKVDCILVASKNVGRIDHFFGNIDSLYQAIKVSSIPVILVANKSVCWLMGAGKHKVVVSKEMLNSHVGLIPVGEPCKVITTTGLVWNFSHGSMKFGELISICNKFDGSEFVTVENDQAVLWTVEYEIT